MSDADIDAVPPVSNNKLMKHSNLGDDPETLPQNVNEPHEFDADAPQQEYSESPIQQMPKKMDYMPHQKTQERERQLPYRVFTVSSQDEDYPVGDLVSLNGKYQLTDSIDEEINRGSECDAET
mgnify:CR=1 FL=1|jgi:hypothetical protein